MSGIAPVIDETQNAVEHAEIKAHISQNEEYHKRLNGSLERIDLRLEKLHDMIDRRLPLWTTLLMSLMSGLLMLILGLYLKT